MNHEVVSDYILEKYVLRELAQQKMAAFADQLRKSAKIQ